jgi:ribosomal protein S12 methylthiotransferase accessory factor
VEGVDAVATLARRVEAAGSTLYAVDVTSPDVRELGLVVLKTLAPELCALDVPHSARFLGGRRLFEAPVQLGLREHPLHERDVNPEPHPFP